jgi:hypothetical protein
MRNPISLCACLLASVVGLQAAEPTAFRPTIPRIYDAAETATWHVPLALAKVSPSFLTSSYFYARKVRPIYKTYPVYHPDREPAGYLEMLKSVEPEILWDDAGHRPKLETEADWIRAGELVYDSPIFVMPVAKLGRLLSREQLRRVQAPVDRDGRLPVNRYAVRIKGEIELGWSSCADCHTRVLPDGTWVKGTQGNFPNAKLAGFGTRIGLNGTEAEIRESAQAYYGTPWHVDGPNARLRDMTLDGFVQSMEACPPGVYPNHNGSYWSPAHAAELRGIKDRRYLDATGHMRHRGPGDLMRFIDFHQ